MGNVKRLVLLNTSIDWYSATNIATLKKKFSLKTFWTYRVLTPDSDPYMEHMFTIRNNMLFRNKDWTKSEKNCKTNVLISRLKDTWCNKDILVCLKGSFANASKVCVNYLYITETV